MQVGHDFIQRTSPGFDSIADRQLIGGL